MPSKPCREKKQPKPHGPEPNRMLRRLKTQFKPYLGRAASTACCHSLERPQALRRAFSAVVPISLVGKLGSKIEGSICKTTQHIRLTDEWHRNSVIPCHHSVLQSPRYTVPHDSIQYMVVDPCASPLHGYLTALHVTAAAKASDWHGPDC